MLEAPNIPIYLDVPSGPSGHQIIVRLTEWQIGYVNQWRRPIERRVAAKRVVESGCFNYFWPREVLQLVAKHYGFSPSEDDTYADLLGMVIEAAVIKAVTTLDLNDPVYHIPEQFIHDTTPNELGLYVLLMHGRNSPDEDMEDWGFDGPWIGPLKAVHVTYNESFDFIFDNYETGPFRTPIREGCFLFDGKYYGDWEFQIPKEEGYDY